MGDFNHSVTRGAGKFEHKDYLAPGSSYETTVPTLRILHSRVGATTPKYREKARNGTLPMLPLDYRYTVIRSGKGMRIINSWAPGPVGSPTQTDGGDFGVNGNGIFNTKVGITRLTSSETASIEAAAATRVLNRIKNQQINVPQDIGERMQTLRLLKTTVQRLAMAAIAFKQGQLSKAVSILGSAQPSRRFKRRYKRLQLRPSQTFGSTRRKKGKLVRRYELRENGGSVFSPSNFASLWLEFQYGWRPLVGSVQGAIQTYQESLEKGQLVKVQSYVRETYDRTVNSTTNFNSFNRAHHVNKTTGTYKVAYTIYYKLVNSGSHDLAVTGFSNPLNLGWELIPFSFVADWFVGIGNYLSSLDATLGLAFEKGCRTVSDRSQSIKTTTFETDYTYQDHSGSVVSSRDDLTIKREVLTDFPTPSYPTFKGWNLGIQNYVTSAALLWTIFNGKGKPTPYRMR